MLKGYGVWVVVRQCDKRDSTDTSYSIAETATFVDEFDHWNDAMRISDAMVERGQVSLRNKHHKSQLKPMIKELTC